MGNFQDISGLPMAFARGHAWLPLRIPALGGLSCLPSLAAKEDHEISRTGGRTVDHHDFLKQPSFLCPSIESLLYAKLGGSFEALDFVLGRGLPLTDDGVAGAEE
jgi:hypothetical protein